MARRKRQELTEASERKQQGIWRVCCYLRRSVEKEGGMEQQREFLFHWLGKNPLCQVVGLWEEEGKSGYFLDRPAFSSLCRCLEERKAEMVLVKDLSRLGRNYKEVGALLAHWEKKGIRLVAPGDGLDTAEPFWQEKFLAVALKTMGDEWYLWDISQKEKAARRAMMLRGEFAGGKAPFGFRRQGRQLVEEEREMALVGQILLWHQRGKSFAAISRRLNLLGIAAPSGGNWRRQTVAALVKNPIYEGMLIQGKRKRVEPRGRREKTCSADWVVREWKGGQRDAVCGRILPGVSGQGEQRGKPEDIGGRSSGTGGSFADASPQGIF